MIVSIVFRHTKENKHLRHWIETQCYELQKYTQKITRIQVVITRISHHKNSPSSLQCHISIQASGRRYIDIYEKHSNDGIAFNRAYDRASSQLSQQYSARQYNRRQINDSLYQLEEPGSDETKLIS